jgi:SAM-dependent methyltransferase
MVEKTHVSDEIIAKTQQWRELRGHSDPTGLLDGEETVFANRAERDEYFTRPIYGERFNTAIYLKPEREFNQMMFLKAGVRGSGRLLLIGEALEPLQIVELGQETLGPDVDIVPFEMRHLSRAHNSGTWGIYQEVADDYADGEFDAVIAAQWHHCDDLKTEFAALPRIVRDGGKIVLVDNGPMQSTFDIAARDVLLNFLLRTFVTWAGTRNVPTSEAYEYKRSVWLRTGLRDVYRAAQETYDDVHLWEYKGMAMIDGRKR